MSDPLAIYLHDHLAGSNFAIELLEFLRDQHAGQKLGDAAGELLAEVEKDRKTLQGWSCASSADNGNRTAGEITSRLPG